MSDGRAKKKPAKRRPPAPRKPRANARPNWDLRLYVAGETPRSRAAIENLRQICRDYLGDRSTLEVIDLRKDPSLARGDQIVAVPTLVRKLPPPMKRILGDLSNVDRVLVGLDLRTD